MLPQEAEALPAQETLAARGQERGHREEADGEEGVGHRDQRRPQQRRTASQTSHAHGRRQRVCEIQIT